jgi:aquaporin Z
MNRLLTEAIGTFFLVYTIGLTSLSQSVLAPFAIGSILMTMVYMGGPISGGHYNPAVTLAVFLRGKLKAVDVPLYWLAQLAGAVLAAVAVMVTAGMTFTPAPSVPTWFGPMLLVEILFTFALALVVLHTATVESRSGNSYFGLAIGFTLMVGAFAGGHISGGAFNPAVGAGPILVDAVMGGGSMSNLWLYLVGPFVGGALAAAIFRMQGNPA